MLSSRWPARLAWSLWVLSLALTLGSFLLVFLVASVDSTLGFAPGVYLALLLFPTGRLPSRRWRPVAWLVMGGYVLPRPLARERAR